MGQTGPSSYRQIRGIHIKEKDKILHKLNAITNKSSCTCWLYTGTINNAGYGQISIDNILYLVHRLSLYVINKLDINNSDFLVLHKAECPNRNCWFPEHLYIGNQTENMGDYSTVTQLTPSYPCGHERKPENTYTNYRTKGKGCKRCALLRSARNRTRGSEMFI